MRTSSKYISEPVIASPIYVHESAGDTTAAHNINYILMGIIALLLMIIGIFIGVFFMQGKNNNTDEGIIESNINNPQIEEYSPFPVTESTKAETIHTETISAESVTEVGVVSEYSVNAAIIDMGYTVSNSSELYQIYYNIISANSKFIVPNSGALVDLNNDGMNEMIITDASAMDFQIYYCLNNHMYSYHFGGFQSLDSFKLFTVDNPNGSKYIYHRSEYAYRSLQGYYDFDSSDILTIGINYIDSNSGYSADWNIEYKHNNSSQNVSSGTEPSETFYGQVPNCHNSLMNALPAYGFNITEGSNYSAVELLEPERLKSILSPNTESDKTTDLYANLKQKIISTVNNENYQGNDSHIENAPSDMVFYDIDQPLSEITLTNFSLLSGAGNNFGSVYSNTGSETFKIVGENNDWYYLMFFSGTGRFTHSSYGYISKNVVYANSVQADNSAQSNNYNSYSSSASTYELGYMYGKYLEAIIMNDVYCGYTLDIGGDGKEEILLKITPDAPSWVVAAYENGSIVSNMYMGEINLSMVMYQDGLVNSLKEKAKGYFYSCFEKTSNVIGYVDTNGDTLNVRSSPSSDSSVVTEFMYGTYFNVLECYDSNGNRTDPNSSPAWYYVSTTYDGVNYSGYVSGSLVSVIDTGI